MTDRNPSRAITVTQQIEMMCDFLERPFMAEVIENNVPVTMPPSSSPLASTSLSG